MPRVFTTPLLLIALTGCPRGDSPEVGARGDADRAVCLEGETFVATGSIPVAGTAADGNARAITALRWEEHQGCERFVIDLAGDGGEPAEAVTGVSAEVLRNVGVVRISLRSVDRVDEEATEERFDGSLARGAYSVFSPEGRWVFVDVHLARAAEAHVALLTSPARVVIDLRPGGGTVPQEPPTVDHVVLLQPRGGEASYPLEVIGYARTFEANVVVRLEQNGEQLFQDFTTATAWADAWGYFTLTVPDGPRGRVTLHAGEHSARDGTWEGAAVELEMR